MLNPGKSSQDPPEDEKHLEPNICTCCNTMLVYKIYRWSVWIHLVHCIGEFTTYENSELLQLAERLVGIIFIMEVF